MDKTGLQLDLTKLGFETEELAHFQWAIQRPHGMVLRHRPDRQRQDDHPLLRCSPRSTSR